MKPQKRKFSSPKSNEKRNASSPKEITPGLLKKWPLPQPDEESDKEERGRVLILGGSTEMPGAVILAAVAALRAGAGKLRIATCSSIARSIAVAVPESRVIALEETEEGCVSPSAAKKVADSANKVQALLVGPGMIGGEDLIKLVLRVLTGLHEPTLVLDADALACLRKRPACLHRLKMKAVLTPNAEEMAEILGLKKKEITGGAASITRRAAHEFRAIVALKGAETFIASPAGELFINHTRNAGLATSGSGDVLSGIIAGLAARGATPLQAAVWGVYLHARAGDALARRVGLLGFLAREILAEIPALMATLKTRQRKGKR